MRRASLPLASALTALASLFAAGSRSSAAPWISVWCCSFAVASIVWILSAPSITTADRRWRARSGAPLPLLVAVSWLVVAPVACALATLASSEHSHGSCSCDASWLDELPSLARMMGAWQFVVALLSIALGPSFVRQTSRGLARVRGPLEWPFDGHPHARADRPR